MTSQAIRHSEISLTQKSGEIIRWTRVALHKKALMTTITTSRLRTFQVMSPRCSTNNRHQKSTLNNSAVIATSSCCLTPSTRSMKKGSNHHLILSKDRGGQITRSQSVRKTYQKNLIFLPSHSAFETPPWLVLQQSRLSPWVLNPPKTRLIWLNTSVLCQWSTAKPYNSRHRRVTWTEK